MAGQSKGGQKTSSDGGVCIRIYPGQYFDEETGLHWNWYRYYDPGVGRYIKEDPISFVGGMNLYRYVLNNPSKLIDPLGLMGTKFYDLFDQSFLKKFKKTNPVESFLFEEYAKNIPVDHWPSQMYHGRPFDDAMLIIEMELFLEAWDGFECYARRNAVKVFGEKAKEFYISQYGPLSFVGKTLKGLVGFLIGAYSDIGTAGISADLIEMTPEINTLINPAPGGGPQVINGEHLFDTGYTPVKLFAMRIEINRLRRQLR